MLLVPLAGCGRAGLPVATDERVIGPFVAVTLPGGAEPAMNRDEAAGIARDQLVDEFGDQGLVAADAWYVPALLTLRDAGGRAVLSMQPDDPIHAWIVTFRGPPAPGAGRAFAWVVVADETGKVLGRSVEVEPPR